MTCGRLVSKYTVRAPKVLTTQMKAIEHCFPVVLFIMLYDGVPSFEDKIQKCDHFKESYTTQYIPVVLLIMLCKMILRFGSVDKILV